MTKHITPEVIEEAIKLLPDETFCCYALACALSGCSLNSFGTKTKHIQQAEGFLKPLLVRDNISSCGRWANLYNGKPVSITREQWLRKIAQELREGNI